MVTVTSASPSRPTVFPLMPCGSGTTDFVTLGCLATGFTPSSVTFAWKQNGLPVPESIQYPPLQKGNSYTGFSQVSVRRQDWDAYKPFQCSVVHPAGNTEADIVKPKVFFSPPELKVFTYSGEADEVSFLCLAENFSPQGHEIKWLQDKKEITKKISEIRTQTDGKKGTDGQLFSASSILTVNSNEMPAQAEIKCEFKGKNDSRDYFQSISLNYEPRHTCEETGCSQADVDVYIKEAEMEDLFLHKRGTLKCEVKINTPGAVTISWENENGMKMAKSSVKSNGKQKAASLELDITFEEWSQGITLLCIVERDDWPQPVKKLYQRSAGHDMRRPSVFMLPPLEQNRQKTVTLTCYVKDFFPKEVFISWLVDDEAVDPNYKYNTTNPIEQDGSYSAYGHLSLGVEQWQNKDTIYSCVVYHESLVNNTKAIVRSIGQRTFENYNMVNLNMNIPDKCKAQ